MEMQIMEMETGKTLEINPENKLTKENVLTKLEKVFEKPSLTSDFLMTLSFYMDFAISTKDLEVIKKVHNRITVYFLDC